ncbi:class I SAM-dependent methyltransferase [Roseibacillus persicicus]|uniref:class I SAM-dependent methyltransferase n=1 Tax=Roseibacillus persicicus TaxID=454148 RepID=UPI00280F46B7|nr:methyltransferase domain-containing protein [Roseibacillus persicicus]MDQ8188864.1 methyltransferase domain-containing protein [Roseibacillus persicicus]
MKSETVSQDLFKSVYRKRSGKLHRMSYMRRGKYLAVHAGLEACGFNLSQKKVFDFGFGPGSFLLSCPKDCKVSGCEIDPDHVSSLQAEMKSLGYESVNLRAASEESEDFSLPFGGEKYDLIVYSHVLEHVDKPIVAMEAAKGSLSSEGIVVVVLPINEQKPDPKHVHLVDEELAKSWFVNSGYELLTVQQLGSLNYLLQPLMGGESKLSRWRAQFLSLSIGLLSAPFQASQWWGVTDRSSIKKGQIVLVGRPSRAS